MQTCNELSKIFQFGMSLAKNVMKIARNKCENLILKTATITLHSCADREKSNEQNNLHFCGSNIQLGRTIFRDNSSTDP
jgi:hypothetical protein